MSITTVPTSVGRDRWGRPLVVPPGGGKAKAYTRATTVAETLDERWALEKWKCRMSVLGVAERPDLLLAVSAHRDDKRELDRICDKAMEAAKSSAGATTGTALHALSELVDRGQDLPPLPESAKGDLEAYRMATAALQVKAIEQFVVLDDCEVGGTLDRLVECEGRNYIADLKTGSTVNFSMGAIAIQLALYSRGMAYDPATGQRTPLDVDQEWAIVIHLPSGTGRCELRWVNIAHGWEAAQLALRVRAYRKHAKNGLCVPFDKDSPRRPA